MNPADQRRMAIGCADRGRTAIDTNELSAAIESFESAIEALEAVDGSESE